MSKSKFKMYVAAIPRATEDTKKNACLRLIKQGKTDREVVTALHGTKHATNAEYVNQVRREYNKP